MVDLLPSSSSSNIELRFPIGVRAIDPRKEIVSQDGFDFSICTLVSDPSEYRSMVESFRGGGFTGRSEFLYVDNTQGTTVDAFAGLNRLMCEAAGTYLLLAHQDLRLLTDGAPRLLELLDDLDRRDPNWAVAGNSGGLGLGRLAQRITDPWGADTHEGDLPARVHALDENLLIVRKTANLGFSRDLSGFHHYGTDLCLQADLRGHTCYVIDFHLEHRSRGNADAAYYQAKDRLISKYIRAFRSRALQSPTTFFYIASSAARARWGNRLFELRRRLAKTRRQR